MSSPASRSSDAAAPVVLSPAPGAAPFPRMAIRQAALEVRLLLRNGEQLGLNVVIPLMLLFGGAFIPYLDGDRTERLAFAVPGTLALAVLSASFTSLAIATGFERRYGVLRYLGATPLGRSGLILGKSLAVLTVEIVQVALILGCGLALGWEPHGDPFSVLALVLVATAAFAGLAMLIAGALRAEATLALANLVFLLLLIGSGIAFPLDDAPSAVRTALELLPSTALADGLRSVLADGATMPGQQLAVLAVWSVVACSAAVAFFRWE